MSKTEQAKTVQKRLGNVSVVKSEQPKATAPRSTLRTGTKPKGTATIVSAAAGVRATPKLKPSTEPLVQRKMTRNTPTVAVAVAAKAPASQLRRPLLREAPKIVVRNPVASQSFASTKRRNQSLKAVPLATVKPPLAKNNVMSLTHNVTVLSPPSVRKELTELNHERRRTRTLEDDEILILTDIRDENRRKNQQQTVDHLLGNAVLANIDHAICNDKISADSMDESVSLTDNQQSEDTFDKLKVTPIKDAVAFEINFETPIQKKDASEEEDYDDDFESYESDFESETSSTEAELSDIVLESQISSPVQSEHLKQNREQKLDSGNFELHHLPEKLLQLDSIDEVNGAEFRNDSGLGYTHSENSSATPMPTEKTKKAHVPDYIIRGNEIMKKLTLDTMSFTLFQMRPINYEHFMGLYGRGNSTQNSAQTNDDTASVEIQTELCEQSSAWTQFPPQFSRESLSAEKINGRLFREQRIGVGIEMFANTCDTSTNEEFCARPKLDVDHNYMRLATQSVNYNSLNLFLQRASNVIAEIFAKRGKNRQLTLSQLPWAKEYFSLCDDKSLSVVYTHSSFPKTILTIQNTDNFSYVHMWSISNPDRPIKTLGSWSRIVCVALLSSFSDVVIGGLADGSIALWNTQEPEYRHPSANGRPVRVATQIVTPALDKLTHVGAVIAVEELANPEINDNFGFISIQIVSLNESGSLTLWTLLQNFLPSDSDPMQGSTKLNHISPWSPIRLNEASTLNLRTEINPTAETDAKTPFERRLSYFENEIFNDEVLRQLQEHDNQKQEKLLSMDNARCTCLATGAAGDRFYIGTNKNFVLVCSKTQSTNARKIVIDETNFLHTTALQLLNRESLLAVGRSDGSVRIFYIISPSVEYHTEQFLPQNSAISLLQDGHNDKIISNFCAIQNIIESDRLLYENSQAGHNLDSIEVKTKFWSVKPQKPNECEQRRISYGDRTILNGFAKSRETVRSICVTKNWEKLFALSGNRVRMFDLMSDTESEITISGAIGMGLLENGQQKRDLVLLTINGIEVHHLTNI